MTPAEVVALLQVIADLRIQVGQQAAENAELQAENADLRKRLEEKAT